MRMRIRDPGIFLTLNPVSGMEKILRTWDSIPDLQHCICHFFYLVFYWSHSVSAIWIQIWLNYSGSEKIESTLGAADMSSRQKYPTYIYLPTYLQLYKCTDVRILCFSLNGLLLSFSYSCVKILTSSDVS